MACGGSADAWPTVASLEQQRLAAIEVPLRRKEAALRALETQLRRGTGSAGRSVGGSRFEVSAAAQLATLQREVTILRQEHDAARARVRVACEPPPLQPVGPEATGAGVRPPPPRAAATPPTAAAAAPAVAAAPAAAPAAAAGAMARSDSAPAVRRRPQSAGPASPTAAAAAAAIGGAVEAARQAWRGHEEQLATLQDSAPRTATALGTDAQKGREHAEEQRRQRAVALTAATSEHQLGLRKLVAGASSRVGSRAPTAAAVSHREDARALGDEVRQQRAQAWGERGAALHLMKHGSATRVQSQPAAHGAGAERDQRLGAALQAKPMYAIAAPRRAATKQAKAWR